MPGMIRSRQRSHEHEEHGGNFQAAAEAYQKEQNDGKKSRGGNGGGHLYERLGDAGESGIGTDGDADRNGPERPDDKRHVDAEKSQRGALPKLNVVLAVQIG